MQHTDDCLKELTFSNRRKYVVRSGWVQKPCVRFDVCFVAHEDCVRRVSLVSASC